MTIARLSLALLASALTVTPAAATTELIWSGPLYSEACTRLADNGMIESANGDRWGEITADIGPGIATLDAARTCASAAADAAKLNELMIEDGPAWQAFVASFNACMAERRLTAGAPKLVSYQSCAWGD